MALYSYNTLTASYDPLPIIPAGRNSAVSYKTAINLDWTPQNAANGWTAVHSQIGTDVSAVTSAAYGMRTSSSKQILAFTVLSKSADILGVAAQTGKAGMQIFTTKQLRDTTVYSAIDPDLDGNALVAKVLFYD